MSVIILNIYLTIIIIWDVFLALKKRMQDPFFNKRIFTRATTLAFFFRIPLYVLAYIGINIIL